jgi:hypothetical protein
MRTQELPAVVESAVQRVGVGEATWAGEAGLGGREENQEEGRARGRSRAGSAVPYVEEVEVGAVQSARAGEEVVQGPVEAGSAGRRASLPAIGLTIHVPQFEPADETAGLDDRVTPQVRIGSSLARLYIQ